MEGRVALARSVAATAVLSVPLVLALALALALVSVLVLAVVLGVAIAATVSVGARFRLCPLPLACVPVSRLLLRLTWRVLRCRRWPKSCAIAPLIIDAINGFDAF